MDLQYRTGAHTHRESDMHDTIIVCTHKHEMDTHTHIQTHAGTLIGMLNVVCKTSCYNLILGRPGYNC